jgi:glutathione S-transferase
MLTLFGGARSRASIVKWYLEELVVPYVYQELDMKAGEHLQPEFLAINPFGKVPAIADGEFKLWESGAILLYLAQKHGAIAPDTLEFAQTMQWVFFANSTLATGLFSEQTRDIETPRLLNALEQILLNQPFLLGASFSVADVAVGAVLHFAMLMLQVSYSAYPQTAAYVELLTARPAFQKVFTG